MRASSAKAKGRRAVQELKEALLRYAPELQPADIEVKATAVPGEDLWLSPAARARFPFAFEVKNVEKLNVWQALAQAEAHGEKAQRPALLCFKRNRSALYVALSLEDFLSLGLKRPES